jgi:Skp family chaperone for outer membrane proteins
VCDHTAGVGGICNTDVIRSSYYCHIPMPDRSMVSSLKNKKKNAADAVIMQKRKALTDEAAELKSKKQKLETDMVALTASADEFAEKAEKEHKLTLIAKSNAMRKAANEKDLELEEVEQQLNAKLLELINC